MGYSFSTRPTSTNLREKYKLGKEGAFRPGQTGREAQDEADKAANSLLFGGGAGSGIGAGGEPFPIDQFTATNNSNSTSWSGLPSWATEAIQSYMSGNYGTGPMAEYSAAIAKLRGAGDPGGPIEQYRDTLNKQYQRDVLQPTQQAISSTARMLAGRGTTGSSMANRQYSAVADRLGLAAAQQQSASNAWAANAKLANLKDVTGAQGSFAEMMANLILGSRESTSHSESSSRTPNDMGLIPVSGSANANPGGQSASASSPGARAQAGVGENGQYLLREEVHKDPRWKKLTPAQQARIEKRMDNIIRAYPNSYQNQRKSFYESVNDNTFATW